MRKLVKAFKILFGSRARNLSTKPDGKPKSKYVDLTTKTVYGGDLPNETYKQSFGSLLFNRMMRLDRREDIFQISESTQDKMKTKEYLERSVAIAERLKEEGIKKGDFVLLIGSNSLNMNVSIIGIFLLAAIPLPLSFKVHLDEFKSIVESLNPKYFGCDKRHLFPFKKALAESGFDVSRIFLLDEPENPNEDPEGFNDFIKMRGVNFESFEPAKVDDPKNELALAMKAMAEGRHGRVAGISHHNLNSVIARYDSTDDGVKMRQKVILQVQSVMWMSGLYGLILSCCFGSKLIVMSEFDEESFFKAVNDYKVTSTFVYSSKCWQLYKHNPKGVYDLSSCKDLFAVDGSLPRILMDGLKEKMGSFPKPSYGITELTGLVMRPANDFIKEGSSGQLVPQIYAKVISDKTSKYAGPNEKGELCFKGSTVINGYVNDGSSSINLFNKEGYLLSGHYGYYDEDGEFYIIDKIIHQIKYKDFKVSPRELEGIIRALPSVKDVCVSGIPHPTDGQYPIAFVSLTKGHAITEEEIINYVHGKVSDHKKLRGGVIFLTKIPRLRDNGALNRNIFKKVLSKYRVKFNPEILDEISDKKKKPSKI